MSNQSTNLNQLRVFREAARLQSFSRAAEALSLTQPGISKHIKQLEEHYGTRLFERLGKKVVLTQAGEVLFETTEAMFERLDQAKARIDDMKNLRGGKIRIGASVTAGVYVLPGLLGHFIRTYPSIEVSTEISLSEEVEGGVLSNDLDLGFVGHRVANEKLLAHRFLTDQLVVIVPPDHPWAKRKIVRARQLVDQPFLVSREGSGTRKVVQERLRAKGITLDRVMEFGNTESVKKAVEAGLGISVVSEHAVAREVSSGWIRAVPLTGISSRRDFYIIHLADRYVSNLLEAFLSLALGRPPQAAIDRQRKTGRQ